MTVKKVQAEVAHIKQTIASSTSCTTNTVSQLSSLLFPETKSPTPKTDGVAPKSRTGQPTKGGRPRARKQPDTEAPRRTTTLLDDQDRERLATEVINITLKALSEAVKSQSLPKPRSNAKNAPCPTTPPSKARSSQGPKSPLQPLCVNRVLLGKEQNKGLRHSKSTDNTGAASSMCAQAECARLAFSVLRTYQARKQPEKALQPLKIELAMSTLISKLIALELFDPAVRELHNLKRSLLVALGVVQKAESTALEKAGSKLKTTDLLVFPTTNLKGPLLAMVVTFQLQVMRLIAAKRDASLSEASIDHLATKVPYSPANLIQAQLDSADPSMRVQVANQLETLSQMVASMSPSQPRSEVHAGSSRPMSPLAALQLQLLSLELRCQWWKVAGHRGDAARDLLDPFNRFVGAFRRQCRAGPVNGYHVAKDTLSRLECFIRNVEHSQSSLPAWYEAWRSVCCEMIEFSQACSLDNDGGQWLEEYMKQPVDDSVSPCRRCTEACKKATIVAQYLRGPCSGEETQTTIETAVRLIEGDLHGSSDELDTLLLAVIKLRKAAGIHINKSQLRPGNNETPPSSELIRCFSSVCSSSVVFLNRYVGTKPTQSNEKVVRRYHQRLEQASTIAKTFIDSVVLIARLSKGDEPDQWARTEAGLQGCLRLAATIDSDQTSARNPNSNNATFSTFVSVSNAYWLRYVYFKQSSHDAKEMGKALKASIDAVENRPLHERSAAQLQIRLEHYASAMEASREYQKAAETNKKALWMHIEMGDLDRAAAAAGKQSLTTIFVRESDFASLGRILVAYPRVAIKIKSDVPINPGFFDDEQIKTASRGIALEQQLASLISQARVRSWETQMISVMQAIATKLLALYELHTFPIRRLRVTAALLWLQSSYPGVLSSSLLKIWNEDRTMSGSDEIQGYDSDLQFTAPYLKASINAASAIQNKCSVSMQQQLESAFVTWNYQVTQCTDARALEAVVGDAYVWLVQLELLANYLDAYGLGILRSINLEILFRVREKVLPSNFPVLVLNLTQCGLQHLRLGHIGKAGVAFHRAHRYINELEVIGKVGTFYYVGYSEYLLSTGSVSKCEENLAIARDMFDKNVRYDQAPCPDSRNNTLRMVADAASLCSQLAARKGHPFKPLLFARQSLKIAHHLWISISRRHKSPKVQDSKVESKTEMERLEDSMAEATVSDNDGSEHSSAIRNKAPELWSLIPRLHRAFIQVAILYANEGMSAEAKCYLERSRKFAESVSASGLLGQSLVRLANIMTRSEDYVGAGSSFEIAGKLYISLDKDQEKAMFQLHLSKYQLAKGQLSAAEETCALAESVLQRFTATASTEDDYVSGSNVDLLQEQLSRFSLREDAAGLPASKKRIPVKTPGGKVPPACKGTKIVQKGSCDASASSGFRSDVLHQQIMLALRGDKFERVNDLLAESAFRYCTPQEAVFNAAVAAEISFRRGIAAMTSDPVFCVLPESTISLPSLLPIGSLLPSVLPKAKPVKTIKGPGNGGAFSAGSSKIHPSPRIGDDTICLHFREARLNISRVYELAQRTCTTAALHHLSKLMAETIVMLSALGLSCSAESLNFSSSMIMGIMDMPRSIAVQRGQRATSIEKMMLEVDDALCWPTDKAEKITKCVPSDQPLDAAGFQEQYVDMIPQSWQVLTLSLSRSRGEIVVSRLRSGQGPFILSMPLDRHSSRDPDEESFDYSQAKAELQDIIALADQSTHGTQDTSKKGARSAWWEGRAGLDARLQDLVTNIEHMWFGGFHGVFSQRMPHRNLLSRFQVSLNAILDNHLPSRQGQGKKHQSKQISVDPRVMELFVALGEPLDLSDMEEPLTDLLYFVIDILQFCGERNAYDEVDFDSMTIATFDALRQYHEAVKEIAEAPAIQHTVLILDKELHCFPWESLPCLNKQAITRLPSLSCLRDGILQQRRQQMRSVDNANDGEKRFCVDRRSGAYVLNPGGDLKATQETFEQSLSNLGDWEGLTGVEPREEQMKGYLQERDIFLYFGHGSGSQYIRPRAFQRLDKCAVALLMGCSSGKLTEAGEFEPYGTPMSYIQAGCPAVLATLWNVTDRDIDRFSESVLQKWGLLSNQTAPDRSPVKRTARSRGKSKAGPSAPPPGESGNMSLDQAVAQGRGSCIFRYLNGAAPVVYGIPIFIG
ncbi:MAG: hypothetical protein Q9226_001727 [Calogaya cf. arnoldii]